MFKFPFFFFFFFSLSISRMFHPFCLKSWDFANLEKPPVSWWRLCDLIKSLRTAITKTRWTFVSILRSRMNVEHVPLHVFVFFKQLNVWASLYKMTYVQSLTLKCSFFSASLEIWFQEAGLRARFVTSQIIWKPTPVWYLAYRIVMWKLETSR